MSIWHVTIEVAGEGEPPKADLLDDLLSYIGPEGAVIGTPENPTDGRSRYGVDLTIEAEGPDEAYNRTAEVFKAAVTKFGLPVWPIARIEVKSDAELDAELATPSFPDLVGISEIADLLEVTPQRVSKLSRSAGFPRAVADLRSGPVWTAHSVRRFVENWKRQPGRPRTEQTEAASG